MRQQPVGVGVVLLAALVASAACAPMQVHTYVPRSADIRQYHSYAWAPAGDFETGDPRLDNNTLFLEHLEREVDRQMAGKGWMTAPLDRADLVIHFHARIDQRLDLRDLRETYQVDENVPVAQVYDAGTLLLDFVERRANTLVWRGWAEGSVEGVIDNQKWMNERIDTAVTRILATFPPMIPPAAASADNPRR